MKKRFGLQFLLLFLWNSGPQKCLGSEDLPTVYEYYRSPTEQTGLTAEQDGFKLNGLPIQIVSGSIHYFRVHPAYWSDRLQRLRATGANAVDLYIPWNLHEPEMDQFDFGNGTNDMSPFLDIRKFIQLAMEEDLLVVFRPGPYICSEFEFGGLPSWLLRDPDMIVRSNYPGYLSRAKHYFDHLLPYIADLQWKQGGPIIFVQIENEFGGYGTQEKEHLQELKASIEANGINELLFTSDSPLSARDKGALPDVLQTANFRFNPKVNMDALLELQPNLPIYVAEFWSGWFDYWFHPYHSHVSPKEFRGSLEAILSPPYNGSVNFYMFHGGTSYGFLNGANVFPLVYPYYRHDVSSYDYDAPLSESGKYTAKYDVIRELVETYKLVDLVRPEMPPENPVTAYGNVTLTYFLTFNDVIDQIPPALRKTYANPVSMEMLDINGGSGQSYGFTNYRKKLSLSASAKINIGRPRDQVVVLVDGDRQSQDGALALPGLLNFGYWTQANQTFTCDLASEGERTLDLLVENWGRVNFGVPDSFHQRKGLFDQVIQVDGEVITDWEITPLEFKGDWIRSLQNWKSISDPADLRGPVLIQSIFLIDGEPQDTFLDMRHWYKGNVFVNGFNIGRYYKAGPTKTMYIPAPLLKTGVNTIHAIEVFQAGPNFVLTTEEDLGPQSPVLD